MLRALPEAGADVVELGMPFTDPMADGPAIQMSSLRALKAGQTMKKTLDMVRDFRAGDDATPIVLMGYYNPIYIYGVERFLADAKAAGVDGLIVVDLPPEEDEELCLPALAAGLNFIRLATPTTDDKRLPAVLANTSGFVYYVSITGITGAAAPDAGEVASAVARIKRHTGCRWRSASACAPPSRPPPSPLAPTAWWSARRWSNALRGEPRSGRQGDGEDGDRGDRTGGRARARACARPAPGGAIARRRHARRGPGRGRWRWNDRRVYNAVGHGIRRNRR